MGAWAGYLAAVNLASGPSVASSDLVLTDAGDHQTFTISPVTGTRRYIDRNVTVTVQTSTDGGATWSSVLAAGTYTLRYLTAQVVLNTPLSGGTTYQVRLHAFNFYPYALILQATDITPNINRVMLDGTVMQGASGAGWMNVSPGLLSGTFSCKAWMLTPGGTIYVQHLVSSDLLIISFLAPDGTHAVEAYCLIKDTNWHAAVNALVDETLNFQSDAIVSLL